MTDTGSDEGGRDAALELPSDWGVEANAGRMYLHARTDHLKCLGNSSMTVYKMCIN